MKIALFGATGRLGRAIASLAQSQSDLSISEAIAHPDSAFLGEELGRLAGSPGLAIPVAPLFQNRSDLAIDAGLALHPALPSLEAALAAKLPLVIGITALKDAHLSRLREAAEQIPIFYSPNFSIGMALLRRLCVEIAKQFPPCTADLFETHHAQKKDTPSGSALQLACDLKKNGLAPTIHSIRSGKIIGEHRIVFNSDEERLELSHTAHSRGAFAQGALQAARFLQKQKPGLYGMDDLLVSSVP